MTDLTTRNNHTQASFRHWVETYGDLVFDLCSETLQNSNQAELAWVSIFRNLRGQARTTDFKEYLRAWILKATCDYLLKNKPDHSRLAPQNEPLQRLALPEKLLILLRDKYGLPYPEISSALTIPESTIKLRRAQALRSMEEWQREIHS